MLARIPVILVGIPAAYGLLVAAGDLVRMLVLTVICIFGQFELNKILNREQPQKPLIEWLCAICMLAGAHFYGERGLIYTFAASVTALMTATVLRGLRGNGSQRFSNSIFSLIYLPFCLGFFLMLAKNYGGQTLFVIIAAVWALDIGAYAFGMSLRGPRLSPQISPNKTISGAAGGAFSCITFVMLAGHYQFLAVSQNRLWVMALSVAIIGQISDLFESILKRESEIKDSGALLGAHGGVLDRIDSILFLGPLCYALYAL
ncbi:MAG: hypothetical protein EOM80_01765 [Erysipelotrichia bacterium]|nr:hypothetical protein [Erysipelotrichia bacterium]